jgi:hypothetical protein
MTDAVTVPVLEAEALAPGPSSEVPVAEVTLDIKSTPAVDAAAKEAAEKAAAEEKPIDDAVTVIEYVETGDPGLDLALAFVGNLGIDETHPAMASAINGDFKAIKEHLASLGDKAKGWEKHVALAEQSYKAAVAADNATNTAITNAVHETVGGEAEWAKIKAWASKEADPEEKVTINKMLTGSPTEARAAALMLQGLYDKASNVIREPANPTKGSAGGPPVPTNTPLTRREAVLETNKLVQRFGSNGIEQNPEYRALWARVPTAR